MGLSRTLKSLSLRTDRRSTTIPPAPEPILQPRKHEEHETYCRPPRPMGASCRESVSYRLRGFVAISFGIKGRQAQARTAGRCEAKCRTLSGKQPPTLLPGQPGKLLPKLSSPLSGRQPARRIPPLLSPQPGPHSPPLLTGLRTRLHSKFSPRQRTKDSPRLFPRLLGRPPPELPPRLNPELSSRLLPGCGVELGLPHLNL